MQSMQSKFDQTFLIAVDPRAVEQRWINVCIALAVGKVTRRTVGFPLIDGRSELVRISVFAFQMLGGIEFHQLDLGWCCKAAGTRFHVVPEVFDSFGSVSRMGHLG